MHSYSRELPSRFQRDILRVLFPGSQTEAKVSALNQLLTDIGTHPTDVLSPAELLVLSRGSSVFTIRAFIKLLQKSIPK